MKYLSGFYKLEDDVLRHAPIGVYDPAFTITNETHTQFQYPIDGWYWFEDEDAARIFFGLPLEE